MEKFTRNDFTIQKTILAYSRVRSLLNEVIDVKDVIITSKESQDDLMLMSADIVADLAEKGRLDDFVDYAFVNINPSKRLDVDQLDMEVITQLAYDFFTDIGKNLIKSLMIKKADYLKAQSMDTHEMKRIMMEMFQTKTLNPEQQK